jgi:tRNA threonylcarbamoyladenosine biosynthesis protein TsaB
MHVLALDTATRAGSVALVEDDRVVVEREGDAARSHGERLPAELLELLRPCGLSLADVDLFAVAAGPGSFTGLRIGVATIQGLAFVTGRPVVPVSRLEALAQAGGCGLAPGSLVAVWMDARRREVFTALYEITAAAPFTADRLVERDPPAVGDPVSELARWERSHPRLAVAAFAGDGAVAHEGLLAGRGPVTAPGALAGIVGLMAAARARSGGAVAPDAIQPLYVRRPDAELARDAGSARPRVRR